MSVSFRSVLVGAVIGLGLVGAPSAWAASTVSCHCFRDRSFDPARPAAADTYVLATSRNSLLAAAFGVSKGTVVRSLMTGTAPEALWAAHGLAACTGLRAGDLLAAHSQTGSWARAVERMGYDPARIGGRVGELVRAGQDPAPAVVDETLATRMGVPREQVAALRAAGASDAETVAASVLGRLTGKDPVGFLEKVRAGKATWGSQFHDAGVAPSDIDDAIARLLR